MRRLSALRFFAAVSPPAPPLMVVLALLGVGAAALEAADAGSSDWILASVALLQLFACATGFTRHASRGRYDPVLPAGARRPRVALAHFAVSAAPGAAAWVAVGIAQAAAAGAASVPAFRPAGWATLLLVSAIPWAAAVRSAPQLPGVLWLLASASLVASGRIFERLALIRADPGWAIRHPIEAFGVALAFPFAIPSLTWPAPVLLAFVAASLAALAVGFAAIASADFALAEEGP